MRIYVGGAHQGQNELAERENSGTNIIYDFHMLARGIMERGGDVQAFAARLIETEPGAVITCNEIGAGIVPMEESDRAWRENVGRAMCVLAQNAESVTRVVCGVGVRIK